MFSIKYFPLNNQSVTYNNLTQAEAEQMFKDIEAVLLPGEQVILFSGLQMVCSATYQ